MSFYGSSVEYGLHCLLHLVEPFEQGQPSSRELAEFQGISPSYVAKLFTRLEKAGLVVSMEGVGGGFRLARSPERMTVLEVVDALEGDKPLFECRNIRDKCILYGKELPHPKRQSICSIHAVMVEAERRMRESLAETTLASLAAEVKGKSSAENRAERMKWFRKRLAERWQHADGTEDKQK
jgi:Rrf2 family protein